MTETGGMYISVIVNSIPRSSGGLRTLAPSLVRGSQGREGGGVIATERQDAGGS